MKKLLLLLMCVLTAVGVRAATTYNMSSSYGTGTLVIDDATGVATVTVTSGTQGHVFGEWFNNLSSASTPTRQDVIDAMNGITKMVYSSGSIFSSADFNDVLNSFTTVTTVDATGMKMYSTTGELDIHDLTYVQTLILDEITAAENNYPKVTINNCDALTTLSLENAFIDYSTTATNVYALAVTNNDNLTSINLDGATIGGSQFGNANLDFSGNTALTTLDLSGVTLRPNAANANINLGTGNAITTLLLPEGVDTSKLSGDVPTIKATYSSSDMVLHVADATDPYTYWYQGTMTAKKNITIDMSNLTAGELGSVLASAQAAGVTYNKVKINGPITASDIEALADVNALVLDLSDATISGSMNANSTVKFLIMPDESTREEVTAAAANFTNLLSAVALWDDASNNRHLVGYNTTAGSLQAAVCATGECTANSSNFTRNGKTAYYPVMNTQSGMTLRYVTLAGPMNAYDMSSGEKLLTDGHYVWDKASDENTLAYEGMAEPRNLNGTDAVYGAMSGGGAVWEIDLEQATFPVITDMTLTTAGIMGNPQGTSPGTWKVIIPTDQSVNEIPPYFLGDAGCSNGVKEICIPSNIEIIRTHAFVSVDHIWTTATTGDIDDMVYDNGAWDATDPDNPIEYKGYTRDALGSTLAFGGNTAEKYGTYTLSSNLKLIETAAFANTEPHVKDVYVLATIAPECHVDAFNTKMYIGSGGFNPVITDGIITRESYRNGDTWIAMLHYPRDTDTPQVQRYVDVTREYTIASNTTDDKGNVVYFPSYSEFLASYTQGTTGYLWTAWDPTRAYGELSNNHSSTASWSWDVQQAANAYVTNANNLNDLDNNPWVSFYDVTNNGAISQPEGVIPYYQVNWNGRAYSTISPQGNLYPAIATAVVSYNYVTDPDGDYVLDDDGVTYRAYDASTDSGKTRYKINQVPATDAWGNILYEQCSSGTKVLDYSYVADANGKYVENYVQDASGNYVLDYNWVKDNTNGTHVQTATSAGTYSQTTHSVAGATYYSDANGTTVTTPTVDAGYYYLGSEDSYTMVDKNNDAIGTQSQYYKDVNGEKVATDLLFYFDNDYQYLYYSTDSTAANYTGTTTPVSGVTTYYTDNTGATVASPITLSQTYYTDPVTTEKPKYSSTWDSNPGATHYYKKNGDSYDVYEPTLQYNTYYIDDGNGRYELTTKFVDGVSTYYAETYSGSGVYSPVTAYFTEEVYYEDGTENVTTYTSTTVWDSSKTYYIYNQRNGDNGWNWYYDETTPTFSTTYYYEDGRKPVYGSSDRYIDGKTWFTYNSQSDTYSQITLSWWNHIYNIDYYYVSGSTPVYKQADGRDYDESVTYFTDDQGTVATTVNFASPVYIEDINYSYTEATGSEPEGTDLYRKAYTGTFRTAVSPDDDDEQHYTYVDGTYRNYVAATDAHFTRYKKVYGTTYREFDATIDKSTEQRYCPQLIDEVAESVVTKKNDYRGWHQFVLGSYATPTTDIVVNHRSYITDNDWWTICLPYDLNYKEMMLFYGDPATNKVPYLALLTNVVRDLGEQTITLNFSENLMTHKAYRSNGVWIVSDDQPSTDGDAGDGQTVNTEGNDIVLHAGVPYLIRPYRMAQEGGSFATQFDIYGQENVNQSLSGDWRITATTTDYPILYNKIAAAEQLESYEAMALVEKGIYTVPALVKNNDARAEGVDAEGVKNTTLDVKINSATETLPVSADWDYSFVGNLYYNSFLPQNCYFLGWYNQARFFYADYTLSAVSDMSDKNYKFVNVRLWNNNTCIICPNMLASTVKYHNGISNGTLTSTTNTETQTYKLGKGKHDALITPASGSGADARPAQWLIGRTATGPSNPLADDWFSGGSAPQHAAAANPVLMDFGITNMAELTGIEEVKTETKTIPAINDNKVYTIDGRYVGNSIEGLGKGLYILNGKKVVVK